MSNVQSDWRTTSVALSNGTGGEEVSRLFLAGGGAEEAAVREESPAERAANDRLKLLVRKRFERKLTREERARLEIADERLRRLVPLVTEAEIAQVEEVAGRANRLRAQTREMRERYGL